jgi:hypothetical protein
MHTMSQQRLQTAMFICQQTWVAAAELGGRMATPAELRRLLGLLAGFPTSEEQDRRLLQVQLRLAVATACCNGACIIRVRHASACSIETVQDAVVDHMDSDLHPASSGGCCR